MYPVSIYRRVRIDYERNGLSRRELSRKYGYHRKTINKMLEFSIPPVQGSSLGVDKVLQKLQDNDSILSAVQVCL